MDPSLVTTVELILANSVRAATLCRDAFRHNLEEIFSVPSRVPDEMVREISSSSTDSCEDAESARFWHQKSNDISYKLGKAHNCITLVLESKCVRRHDHPVIEALVIWLRVARKDIDTLQARVRLAESPLSNKEAKNWEIIDNLRKIKSVAGAVFKKNDIDDKLLKDAHKTSGSEFSGFCPYHRIALGPDVWDSFDDNTKRMILAFSKKTRKFVEGIELTRKEIAAPFGGSKDFVSSYLTRLKKLIKEHEVTGTPSTKHADRVHRARRLLAKFSEKQPSRLYSHNVEDFYDVVELTGQIQHLSDMALEIAPNNQIVKKR